VSKAEKDVYKFTTKSSASNYNEAYILVMNAVCNSMNMM